ncbi:two-component sensor histidine kinase [Legionella beliardensis]|uniref:histidine kinase n=1 Tax=Legionella beliardensis TaxID=91822 RepID=A0A378I3B2_9GAMM|nr:ATP-binding protein [Legionella beliardensis]STX29669.1 two-component sensor histidine kinase [Legionella beliardensis]
MSNQLDFFELINPKLVYYYQKAAFYLSILTGLACIVVLSGWLFDIDHLKEPFLHLLPIKIISMKVNAVIGFLLVSISLILQNPQVKQTKYRLIIAKIAALFTLLIGVLTYSEIIFNKNLYIDELIFKDNTASAALFPPGRISSFTAVNFILFGVVLLILNQVKPYIYQSLIIVTMIISIYCVIGFSYHLITYETVKTFITFADISPYTAFVCLLVSLSIFLIKPAEGFISILARNTRGGQMMRYLLPLVIALPISYLIIRLVGTERGWWDGATGVAIMTCSVIFSFLIIIFIISHLLDRTKNEADKKLHEALLYLQKSNEELRQLAYVVSHDLQEPLRLVVSYTQLIERRYLDKLDASAHEFMGYAAEGAQRMQSLLTDLSFYLTITMAAENQQALDSRDLVNTESILKKVIKELKEVIEKTNTKINYQSLPEVVANQNQLSFVFQHLISNAIKFCTQTPEILIEVKEKEKEWLFMVHDNGIGIAKEYYGQIFIIFKRLNTRNKFPGSGIGLAICKKIIERHAGRIWVESVVGVGSTFFFTLPK